MPVSAACMASGTPYFWTMSAVGPDVVDVAVGVEDDDRLELEVGDRRDDLLGSAPGSMTAQSRVSSSVDEVAVGLEGADDDDLVLHALFPGPILMPKLDGSQPPPKSAIIGRVDAFITPEARREIEALMVFRPKPGAWGVLVGHRRGSPVHRRKGLPGGRRPERSGRAPPGRPRRRLAREDDRPVRVPSRRRVHEGRPRPGLVRQARPAACPARPGRRRMRPSVVEYERRFFLAPIALAPAAKEKARE